DQLVPPVRQVARASLSALEIALSQTGKCHDGIPLSDEGTGAADDVAKGLPPTFALGGLSICSAHEERDAAPEQDATDGEDASRPVAHLQLRQDAVPAELFDLCLGG